MTGNTYRVITSKITPEQKLELALQTLPLPVPRERQVLIRVEAVPINPSDIGFLVGPGDIDTLSVSTAGDQPIVTMDLQKGAMALFAARVGQALQVCAEGAGVVVDAGGGAKALIGKTVAVMPGRMLAEYRCIDAAQCVVVPEGTTAVEAAAIHANPLTALGMIEVMRREKHVGLVHTAAASNLGQILVKACLADDVPLVNIVRRDEQIQLLKSLGARYVCNSSAPNFHESLFIALKETGSTIAFDATGGGTLVSDVLTAMERASVGRPGGIRTPYGTVFHKQIYIYGGLDRSPLVLNRTLGFAWSIGGWLMTPDQAGGAERYEALRQRVVREIKTTFASHFGRRVSFTGLLSADALKSIAKIGTGDKYMVQPHRTEGR